MEKKPRERALLWGETGEGEMPRRKEGYGDFAESVRARKKER